jgi:N-acetylmuramoyl-L-alanine amidase
MKWFLALFYFVCALGMAPAVSVSAEPKYVDRKFEELKSSYFKLRNTDLALQKENAWIQVAEDFIQYTKQKGIREELAASALFYAASVYEQIFKVTQESEAQALMNAQLTALVNRFPQSELADDALLKMGDALVERGKKREAKAFFERVRKEYPKSDQLAVALARIQELTGHTVLQAQFDRQGMPQQVAPTGFRVLIDPGHGGEDKGGEGPAGLIEKDVVLDIAKRLEEKLKDAGIDARRTRTADEFVPLAERTALANSLEADLFISLHTNASEKGDMSGFQVFYLDAEGDAAAQKLAERENESLSLEGGDGDIQFMLSDFIQNSKLQDSRRLAEEIAKDLQPLAPQTKARRPAKLVAKAPFYVLVGAHMPCVLVELLYLDNADDAKKLALAEYRAQLAAAMAKAIKRYAQK